MLNTGKRVAYGKTLKRVSHDSMKKVIDIHIHMIGKGDSGSGCYMSDEFFAGLPFAATLRGFRVEPIELNDEVIRDIFLNVIDTSEVVDYAVLLALDGVYKNGKPVTSGSYLVIPNDHILNIAKMSSRVLFGASVHPYRDAKEMLAETRRCISAGAALFNWMPSVQQIDPEDDRCIPFYLCLVRDGIPLLIHSGPEYGGHDRSVILNDPAKLERALNMGVKVILSFSATSDNGCALRYDEDHFDKLIGMLRLSDDRKWDLYADISPFCVPSGLPFLSKIKDEIALERISQRRILYGSDFPMHIEDKYFTEKIPVSGDNPCLLTAKRNILDNNYYKLRTSGINESIFTNAGEVLRLNHRRDFSHGT